MADTTDRRFRVHHEENAYQEELERNYEREDERWSAASQARDWLILVGIAAVHLAWMLVIFFVEPGIR